MWQEDFETIDFAEMEQEATLYTEFDDSFLSGDTSLSTNLSPEEVLKKYWGYNSFREKQRDIIDSVLAGKDTLGLLPTGGGKSITFQVPGLMLSGSTLVVTPLIALMKDQVEGLLKKRIKAVALHSGIPSWKMQTMLNNAVFGKTKFLYLSPERLSSPQFQSTLQHLKVSLIVVDECHCVSQWGYDFRPSYLNISILREFFPQVPILALTATATTEVKADILKELKLRSPQIIQKSFARDNLSYVVRFCADKGAMMANILGKIEGSAIVYCRNRSLTAELAQYLQEVGIKADYYHAGLSHAERDEKQQAWMEGKCRVIVATNAFGMGIDKPDVRLVLHWTMPSSLEEYYQEAGRAGRDGQKAYAVVIVGPHDKSIIKRRLSEQYPPLSFVRKFYDLLMSYLQIGDSDGLGKRVQLDFETFVSSFQLPPIQSHSAMSILEMAGALIFDAKSAGSSRLMIQIPWEELFKVQAIHGRNEKVLDFILRNYTGTFTQYVYIEEEAIALNTRLTLNDVYEALVDLSRLKVLHYIPRSSLPLLTLTTRREPGRLLNIPPEVYHWRKERFKKRLEAVLNYVYSSEEICREKTLLSYFGETDSISCGHCDLCLERTKQEKEKRVFTTKVSLGESLINSILREKREITLEEMLQLLEKKGEVQHRSRQEWIALLHRVMESSIKIELDKDRIIYKGIACNRKE